MPTVSDHQKSYIPRRTLFFQDGNSNDVHPMTTEQFHPFDVEPPPGTKSMATPCEIKTDLNDVENIESGKKKARRLPAWAWSLIALAALALIGGAVGAPVALNRKTATSTTLDNGLSSLLTTTTTTTTTATTTTVNCVSPYVLSSSGTCVNVLIDVSNCGSVGRNCSSNYTSCSAGVCSTAPSVQLLNSNFIWTSAINGSVDDAMYGVRIPMNITLYSTTTDFVYVTTNGVICLGSCATTYSETPLPGSPFSGATVLPYWDDLYIYSGTSQGIYYAAEGTSPNRTLTFEFYMSHYNQPQQYYHYQVIFFEYAPGVVQFKYFDASDGGVTCTVGVQASSSGPFIQYSYDLANSVRSNMSLTFDTNLGIYRNSTF